MSPTIAQRRFTTRNRNSTITENIKSCRYTLRKTFKSVATSIAHALDDDFYGAGTNDFSGRNEVVREYPELNLDYGRVSRRISDVSTGTLAVSNYQRQLALPMGKLQVHRPPPTPIRRRTVSVAGSNNADANANADDEATGKGGEVHVATPRRKIADKEDRRSVSSTPKRSPFAWTPRSIQSKTTDDTDRRTTTETTCLSDRASSLLSGSINYFSKSRLVASRSSSTIRRSQVRFVSPAIDLTRKDDAEAQPGLPKILVTQASTRCGNVVQSNFKSDGLVDSSQSSPSIEIPRVLRPVRARLVDIPPRARVASTIEPIANYGRKWRCGDATVGAEQSDISGRTAEQRANRRKGVIDFTPYLCENDKSKERLSLYRPYHPRESWRTNHDKHSRTSSRSRSSKSSQVSAEQNRQLISSLGISSAAYNRLLAALERGSLPSDSDNEAEAEAGAPSRVSTPSPASISTEASLPVRIPTVLRPQHIGTVRYSRPESKVNIQANHADDVFVGKSLSSKLARQQNRLFEKEQVYRRAIQTLWESSSESSSQANLASDDSTVLQARLTAMIGSTDCYHAMMSAGNVARGRREGGRKIVR